MREVLATGAVIVTVLGWTACVVEHEPSSSGSTIAFEGRNWRHDVADQVSVEEYRGKTALHLYGGPDNSVYLPEVEFQDGTIEVDFATVDRSTPGIGFRGRDNGTWCSKILFNHWPGNDQDHGEFVEQAVVTRRSGTVLVLNIRGSGQDSLPDGTDGPEWFHVKVVVQGDGAKVYLNGAEEPSIEVGAVFDRNRKGVLGLCGGGGGGSYFANFRYNTLE